MARIAGAHFLVAGPGGVAAGVARGCADDTVHVLEDGLNTPEASPSEYHSVEGSGLDWCCGERGCGDERQRRRGANQCAFHSGILT